MGSGARALAIAQFGYSTGEAMLPVLVALALVTYGWRDVWQITALVLILLFIPALSLLFRGQPTYKTKIAATDTSGRAQGAPEWNRSRVLRDGLFWWVLLGILANSGIVTLIFFHQADLVAAKGWSPLVFAASFPILSVSSAVAGIVGGTLLDRFGAWRLLPYLLLPLCLSNLVLWLGSAEWTIAVFFFLTGVSAGMVNGAASVVWAELYGTTNLGAIRALATAGLVFASAAGPGLAGLLIDAGIPLQTQCLYYALYCGAASVMYLVLSSRIERRVRQTAA
ncbi:MAG: MFS transporter [Rhizobium sp.]|nr:MFS transporter [Rhizobium sp.]